MTAGTTRHPGSLTRAEKASIRSFGRAAKADVDFWWTEDGKLPFADEIASLEFGEPEMDPRDRISVFWHRPDGGRVACVVSNGVQRTAEFPDLASALAAIREPETRRAIGR